MGSRVNPPPPDSDVGGLTARGSWLWYVAYGLPFAAVMAIVVLLIVEYA